MTAPVQMTGLAVPMPVSSTRPVQPIPLSKTSPTVTTQPVTQTPLAAPTSKALGPLTTDDLNDMSLAAHQTGARGAAAPVGTAAVSAPTAASAHPQSLLKGLSGTEASPSVKSSVVSAAQVGADTVAEAQHVVQAETDAPPPAPPQIWALNAGGQVLSEMQAWAKIVGWNIEWNYPVDWIVPSTTVFSGTFQNAVSQAVEALRKQALAMHAQGSDIHADFYPLNHMIIIDQTAGAAANDQ